METEDYLSDKHFVDLPDGYKNLEIYFRPSIENYLNEIRSELGTIVSAENLVRNEGIELAIQRYGLRMNALITDPGPSGSNVPQKKMRVSDDNQDVLLSAIGSAIADKGLSADPST